MAAPRLGMLLPHQFLPLVARSDLARPLSDWVLRAAVRDAASWRDPDLRVNVNVWARRWRGRGSPPRSRCCSAGRG